MVPCSRTTISVATEAMECLGGNGYVEEGPIARLWREAPLNGIWEGSANVICLDALRALDRSEGALAVLEREAAAEPRAGARLAQAKAMLAGRATAEANARAIVESLALCVQASLMRRHADALASDAFCASRLEGAGGELGTLRMDAQALGALAARARLEL